MERHVAVVAGEQVFDATLLPASTPRDVLRQAGLPETHFLSLRDGLPFGIDENIYPRVRAGEKLYANPEATVAIES